MGTNLLKNLEHLFLITVLIYVCLQCAGNEHSGWICWENFASFTGIPFWCYHISNRLTHFCKRCQMGNEGASRNGGAHAQRYTTGLPNFWWHSISIILWLMCIGKPTALYRFTPPQISIESKYKLCFPYWIAERSQYNPYKPKNLGFNVLLLDIIF